MVRMRSTRVWLALAFLFADVAVLLPSLAGCSGGGEGKPVVVPSTPIAMSAAPGRGLANPWTIVPSTDGKTLLVQERAAGRLARVDVASGAITRVEPPSTTTGSVVALAADPANPASALVLLGGFPGDPVDPPLEPAVRGSVFRIGITAGDWEPVMESSFGGTGFYVDASGTGAYTWRDGIDHVEFATGARERLERCADVTQVIGVDPLGRSAHSIGFYAGDMYTTPIETISRCDLGTDQRAATSRDYSFQAVSLACGARRLYRAQDSFSRYTTEGRLRSLYEVLDATTLESLGSLDLAGPVAGLVPPGGPVATDADCSRTWFATPSGIFGYDESTQISRRLAEGITPIGVIAAGDRPGTAYVTGGTSGTIGPRRVDLATGEFEEIFEGDESIGEPLAGLAWAPRSRRLRVAVSHFTQSRIPPYWSGNLRVDEIDPVAGTLTKGDALDGASASRVASCASGDRLFLLGDRWAEDGSWIEAWLFEYRDSSIRPIRAMSRSKGESTNFEAYPGYGRLAMSRNCDVAYVLGDKLYRAVTHGGDVREVPPGIIGSAMVMDPRQDLLVVESDSNLYGLDLRDGSLNLLAGLREPVLDMTMTDDGKIVWTGATSLGLGVVDLVNGTSARLWEGAGTYGR